MPIAIQKALEEWALQLSKFDETELLSPATEADALSTRDTLKDTNSSMSKTARASSATDFANDAINQKKPADQETVQESLKKYDDKVSALKEKAEQLKKGTLAFVSTADKGNQEFLKSIERDGYKLQESITVVNWSYQHNPQRYLHTRVIKLRQILEANIRDIQKSKEELPEDSLLECTYQALEEKCMKLIGAPSSVTRYKEFVTWTQTQFRGRKAERTIPNSEAQKCVQAMNEYARLQNVINQDINEITRCINTMNAKVRGTLSNSMTDDQTRQTMLKRVDRCCKLFTMYMAHVNMVYRLHTEYILNRRAVLKRLYAAR